MTRFFIILSMVFINTMFLSSAFADGGGGGGCNDASCGFSMMVKHIFGVEKARVKPSSSLDCTTMDQNGGQVGFIDGFFCHMQYDMGLTTVGSATKTFQTLKVHAEITAGCTGFDSNTYDYSANVWVCNSKTADCTNKANFGRVVSACFTSASDYSINKGAIIADNGVFNGQGSGANGMIVSYDLGTASSGQKFSLKIIGGGENGFSFIGRIDGTRSDKNHLAATELIVSNGGSGTTIVNDTNHAGRFAFTLDRKASTGLAYMEGFGSTSSNNNGFGGYSATAKSDNPSTAGYSGVCISRTSDSGTGDFDYTVTSNGTSCAPNITFPAESLNDVAAYSFTTLTGTWNGMSANPTSI